MWPDVEPRGAIDESLVRLVGGLQTGASNVLGQRGEAVVADYRDYVDATSRQLQPHFALGDIDELLRTRTFWATFDVPGAFTHVQQLVRHELEVISNRLDHMERQLGEFRQHWAGPARLVVVDTNVFVENTKRFDQIDWYSATDQRPNRPIRLIVPLMVVDELDNLKTRARQDRQLRVRHTLIELETLLHNGDRAALPNAHASYPQVTIEVLPDPRRHERLSNADA